MSADRAATCLVCGKKFPRGPLDLARHTSAITLMHLTSKTPKPNFDYHCGKCDLYFKLQSHLELHLQSVCPGRAKAKAAPAASTASSSSKPNNSTSANTATGNSTIVKAERVMHEATETREEERTMECMVCGKLFPRGPIDLARHQTAITLRHLVHPRHTSTFHYGCKKCGCHFTTPDHLASHHEGTTCNEDMVWPTTVMPGSRSVTRAQAAELEAAEAAGQAAQKEAKSKGVLLKDTKKISAALTSNREEETLPKRVSKKSAATLQAQTSPAQPLSKYILNKLAAQQHQSVTLSAPSNSKRSRENPSAGGSSISLSASELYVPRTKRAKVIVPEDRQAFFAVVSLLIDPALVPESVRLCEDNYEAYIPSHHRRLVEVLKANLYCTC